MRYSHLFGKTVKDEPSEIKITSYRYLYKAGFIRESTSGRYFILPLGQRVQQKIISIIKDEMDKSGAQEMLSPVLHPLSLWKETNRTKSTGYELMIVKDRRNAEFALGGTAEEMFVDVVRKFQISYRDLPFVIYQFSVKFRDELRARGGLLRVKEFIMKDAYSFDKDETSFKKTYEKLKKTYTNIFNRLSLGTNIIESDNGYIGGDYCHEFVVDSPVGESEYFVTEDESYKAHIELALCDKISPNCDETIKPLAETPADRGKTVADGGKFHRLPLWRQLKTVAYIDDNEQFILALIRGDRNINETKLSRGVKAYSLRMATDDEIRTLLHSEPGFLSPVHIKNIAKRGVKLLIVADDSVLSIRNMYGGANKLKFDYLNINIGRDFEPDLTADIMQAEEKDTYHNKKLIKKQGIEVGNIFQLGYYYSDKMHSATFTDEFGKKQKYYMGCYGIGIGRTMAAIVEKHHDEHGIIWPKAVSPFDIHLSLLSNDLKTYAETVYKTLQKNNKDVLYDDREDVPPGEKLKDADLIGIPIRLVISNKTREHVEYKKRNEKKSKIISLEELVHTLTP